MKRHIPNYALVRDGIARQGDLRLEIITQSPEISFNLKERRIYIKGKPDTVRFSQEFTDEEMIRQFTLRALECLEDYGWNLYSRMK